MVEGVFKTFGTSIINNGILHAKGNRKGKNDPEKNLLGRLKKYGTEIGEWPREKQKREFHGEKEVATLFSMDRSKQRRIIQSNFPLPS